MLRQHLFGAEQDRALDRWRSERRCQQRGGIGRDRKRAGRDIDPEARGGEIEQVADRRPIEQERDRRADRAAGASRLRERIEKRTRVVRGKGGSGGVESGCSRRFKKKKK